MRSELAVACDGQAGGTSYTERPRAVSDNFGDGKSPAPIPAVRARFSRSRGTVQQGPVQRQETQIVQPCNQLADFLPGFRLLPFRRGGRSRSRGACAVPTSIPLRASTPSRSGSRAARDRSWIAPRPRITGASSAVASAAPAARSGGACDPNSREPRSTAWAGISGSILPDHPATSPSTSGSHCSVSGVSPDRRRRCGKRRSTPAPDTLGRIRWYSYHDRHENDQRYPG